jgi:citrate lyase beta subunit
MIVISNHVNTIGMEYPKDSVVRINIAWIESKQALEKILQDLHGRAIWLDYPTGRTKPPQPKFSLDETIEFTKKYPMHYFAFSNAEESSMIQNIRSKVPRHITLVPKIETTKGISNLNDIVSAAQTKFIMLDKEDLYTDVKGNQEEFEKLVTLCRENCKKIGVTCLELKGVIFGYD